jgi:HEAT repeat protein
MPLIRKAFDEAAKPVTPPMAGVADASPDARWAAARSAEGDPNAVLDLAQALARENDVRVREAIFTAIARIGTEDSVLAVLPYIRSDDANLRTRALDALRAMPALLIEPHLPQLLADPDSDVRLLACDLARVLRGPQAPLLLCRLVETDPHPNVCAAAIDVLAEIGSSDAISSLERCAARFPNDSFLDFAIKAATGRFTRQADRG